MVDEIKPKPKKISTQEYRLAMLKSQQVISNHLMGILLQLASADPMDPKNMAYHASLQQDLNKSSDSLQGWDEVEIPQNTSQDLPVPTLVVNNDLNNNEIE